MKLILLSGGSGKRLWPLSNDQRSKQFIKILKNDDGKLESMVQRVWNQLKKVGLQDNTFIATGKSQESILKSQLGITDEKIITEPFRRDTFPAIVLSSLYLKDKLKTSENENIFVLPVDPFVDESFFYKIFELDKLLVKKNSNLGLIGINPTYPSEKYGYILPDENKNAMVKTFIEKPSEQKATSLLEQGACWNAGVFGFKLGNLIDYLENSELSISYEDSIINYDKLPKNSFDYEYVEKQKDICFVTYDGFWKDLGTWNTLVEEMDTNSIGITDLIDSDNTSVINETTLPIVTLGVSDLIVVAGPEGFLVSSIPSSPRVKEIDPTYFETIRYKEEDWGTAKTLKKDNFSIVIEYIIKNGKHLLFKLNKNQQLYKLHGEGKINRNSDEIHLYGIDNFSIILVTEGVI